MGLFKDIEGLGGETLATALLRNLVLRSPVARDAFVRLLSDHSSIGPLIAESHFSCYTERPTEGDEGDAGRIDLIVELDNAVVGIENKFHAEFQSGQPAKYAPDLEKLAAQLGEARRKTQRPLLVVLAPQSRSLQAQEIVANVAETFPCAFVTWEETLASIRAVAKNCDPQVVFLLNEFIQYATEQINFLPDLAAWLPHLRRWESSGTALHIEFVGKLRDVFHSTGRLSQGETWLGYGLPPRDSAGRWTGWYGFVSSAFEFPDRHSNPAEFVVVKAQERTLDPTSFERVALRSTRFLGGYPNAPAWVVKLDATWSDPEIWRSRMAAVLG